MSWNHLATLYKTPRSVASDATNTQHGNICSKPNTLYPVWAVKGIETAPYMCACMSLVGHPKIHTFSHSKLLFCPFVLWGKDIICGNEEKN